MIIFPGQESELLLVKSGVSVSQAQLRLGRDFIIARCAAGATLTRGAVMAGAHLTAELALDMLKQVRGRRWCWKACFSIRIVLTCGNCPG